MLGRVTSDRIVVKIKKLIMDLKVASSKKKKNPQPRQGTFLFVVFVVLYPNPEGAGEARQTL